MADYVDAIKRPFSDWKKFLIGCVLNIIPIVNFLVMGYYIEAIKLSVNKKKNLPEWKDWGNLFVKGLIVIVISFVYMIPTALVMLVGGGTALISLLANGGIDQMALLLSLGPAILLGVVLAILAGYILPVAIINYAVKNSIGAAFELGFVFKKAFTGIYFVNWIVLVIISIIVTAILGWIPFIGYAISGFIVYILGATILGSIFKEL